MNPNPDIDGNLRIARAIRGELPDGFEPVPLSLNRLAEQALSQRNAVHTYGVVNASRRGPLQNWAKKKRKAKAAAESRRRNRKDK